MRLYIPEIGDRITLTQDWTFSLYGEYRNFDVIGALDPNFVRKIIYNGQLPRFPVTFPAGTVMSIDRIYIRKGNKEMSSVTFNIIGGPDKRLLSKSRGGLATGRMRFWARLDDVNRIEFDEQPA